MKTLNRSVARLVLGGATLAAVAPGCGKDEPSPEKPAMKPAATMPTTKPMTAATKPAAAAAGTTMMKEADMTHACAMDCPVFTTIPADATAKPAMMLKKGEKVLVMVPRGKYTQVTTIGGIKGYVPTAALAPIGK